MRNMTVLPEDVQFRKVCEWLRKNGSLLSDKFNMLLTPMTHVTCSICMHCIMPLVFAKPSHDT